MDVSGAPDALIQRLLQVLANRPKHFIFVADPDLKPFVHSEPTKPKPAECKPVAWRPSLPPRQNDGPAVRPVVSPPTPQKVSPTCGMTSAQEGSEACEWKRVGSGAAEERMLLANVSHFAREDPVKAEPTQLDGEGEPPTGTVDGCSGCSHAVTGRRRERRGKAKTSRDVAEKLRIKHAQEMQDKADHLLLDQAVAEAAEVQQLLPSRGPWADEPVEGDETQNQGAEGEEREGRETQGEEHQGEGLPSRGQWDDSTPQPPREPVDSEVEQRGQQQLDFKDGVGHDLKVVRDALIKQQEDADTDDDAAEFEVLQKTVDKLVAVHSNVTKAVHDGQLVGRKLTCQQCLSGDEDLIYTFRHVGSGEVKFWCEECVRLDTEIHLRNPLVSWKS